MANSEIQGCSFLGNTCGAMGGAIFASNCSVSIAQCDFESNTGSTGGAVSFYNGDLGMIECVIANNRAERYGGGLNIHGADFGITYCLLERNEVTSGFGGAVCCGAYTENRTIDKCTICLNVSSEGGSGIHAWGDEKIDLRNTVIASNHGDMAVSCDSAALSCCNIYGNTGGDWVGEIADQFGINGNIIANPMFCNTLTGDFHLQPSSPCAPSNNECGTQIGAFGVGCQ
jgi:predicted outer membrane repeat protein